MSDIMVGYVHMGSVREKFMRSLITAFNVDRGEHLSFYTSASPANICEARCNVVTHFLKSDCSWLWFIDTDIVFPPDTHVRLLEAADPKERPIVSAAYWSDYGDGRFVVWQVPDERGLHPVMQVPDEPLVEIATAGLGCMLVHRSVLEALAEKHKDDPWPWFGNDVINTDKGPRRVGEDMTFCLRARALGFRTWGLNLVVEHHKTLIVEPATPELIGVS